MKKTLSSAMILVSTLSIAQTNSNPSTTCYVHDEPQSFYARMVKIGMMAIGIKNSIPKKIRKEIFKKEPAAIPNSVKKKVEVSEIRYGKLSYWSVIPNTKKSNKVIFYIHGGAYIANMTSYHWKLIESIVSKTNATVIIPNYEIAPFSKYHETYSFINGLYDTLSKKYNPDDIIMMGDSAGGGFALSFAMRRRNESLSLPSQLILLSPWLDITMQNPELPKLDKFDKMLSIQV